jgi:hypothetical protein
VNPGALARCVVTHLHSATVHEHRSQLMLGVAAFGCFPPVVHHIIDERITLFGQLGAQAFDDPAQMT